VYRKRNGKVEILLLRWLNSRKQEELVIPKGKIEKWEVAKDTAVQVIKFVTKLSYTYTAWYLKDNPVIDKDVYLFIVKYNGKKKPVVRKEERFVGYTWIDIEEIKNISVRFDLSGIIYRNKPFFT